MAETRGGSRWAGVLHCPPDLSVCGCLPLTATPLLLPHATHAGTAKLADVGFSRQKLATYLSNLQHAGTFAWASSFLLCLLRLPWIALHVLLVVALAAMWSHVLPPHTQRGCCGPSRI